MPRRKSTPMTDMSGFMLEVYLLQRYGPRLTMPVVAEVLQVSRWTVQRAISANTFQIATYIDNGARYADYRDVARYLDKCRQEAQDAAAV